MDSEKKQWTIELLTNGIKNTIMQDDFPIERSPQMEMASQLEDGRVLLFEFCISIFPDKDSVKRRVYIDKELENGQEETNQPTDQEA